MRDRTASSLLVLGEQQQTKLRAFIAQLGEREVSTRFCVNRITLLAAASGCPIRRSSFRLVELGLQLLAEAEAEAKAASC